MTGYEITSTVHHLSVSHADSLISEEINAVRVAKGSQMTEEICPRCGTTADHSPDDKECSDRCITRHIAENEALRNALKKTQVELQDLYEKVNHK